MSVPSWVYTEQAAGRISNEEVAELEKMASDLRQGVTFAPSRQQRIAVGLHKLASKADTVETVTEIGRDSWKRMAGKAGIIGGAMITAPVAAYGVGKAIDRVEAKSPRQIQKDLETILMVHPEIGKAQDPRVQMAYQSLVKLNPDYAEDPLIAGPILKQIVDSHLDPTNPQSAPYVDPGISKGLTEAYQKQTQGRKDSRSYALGADVQRSVNAGIGAIHGGVLAPGLYPSGVGSSTTRTTKSSS